LIFLSNKRRNLNNNNKNNKRSQSKKQQRNNQKKKRRKKNQLGKINYHNQISISLTIKHLLLMQRIREKLFNNSGHNGTTKVSHFGLYIIKNTRVRESNSMLPITL